MPIFVEPKNVLSKISLKEDMTVADFGSGSGAWVMPLAKDLEKGTVYAVDVLEEPLSALESKLKTAGFNNVRKVLDDVETEITSIPSNSCDLVLMTNLLFQVGSMEAVFKEADRVLKKTGKVLVVDWKKGVPMGPKPGISREEVKQVAAVCGFEPETEFEAGDYHFAIIFIK